LTFLLSKFDHRGINPDFLPYYRGKYPREIFYSSSDSGELTQGVEDSAAFGKEKDFFGGEGNNSNCRLPVL